MNDELKEFKRVAIYIRVSTEEQALNGDSIEAQRSELREFAKKSGYKIVDYYIDDGYTATNLKRPNLTRLLEDVSKNKIDMILFTKIDRWSRGVRNYYKLQDTLDKHSVHWKTIFEDYDTSTAAGRLHINIMLSVAENESAQTSERIKAVFKNKLSRGEVCSGKIPRGYKIENKKLVIDSEVAPMIQDIYNFYEKTNSLNQLVIYVKDTYYHIHQLTLKRILTNSLYIGTHVCESSITENYCEPIISKEQFDKIQKMIKMNVRTYKRKYNDAPPYLFTGMLICKECGKRMVPNRSRRYNKKDGYYFYITYKCQNCFKEHKCINNHVVPEKNILEKYLLDNIFIELKAHVAKFKAINMLNKEKRSKSNKTSIKRKIDRLRELYLDDLISKEDYKIEYELLTKKMKEIEKNEQLPEIKNLDQIENFLNMDLESIYTTLNPTEKRRLWMSVIDKIVLGKDKSIKMILH